MMNFILIGVEVVKRCLQALAPHNFAVWSSKDSKENVQRNMVELLREEQQLDERGIVFSSAADSFLTVADSGEIRIG